MKMVNSVSRNVCGEVYRSSRQYTNYTRVLRNRNIQKQFLRYLIYSICHFVSIVSINNKSHSFMLCKIAKLWETEHPSTKLELWASMCIHFSQVWLHSLVFSILQRSRSHSFKAIPSTRHSDYYVLV